jgi:branched-chain amino acid transport system ATP-binding protein
VTTYFEAKNIVVYYDRVMALKGISLSLQKGEIVTLIGANGAGKSTTLRAVTGLTKIRSGEIWFNGQRIDTLPPQKIVALGIAMVPEGRHIYPLMNVKDNLLMGAYRRNDKEGIRQDLEKLYSRFPVLKERSSQQGNSLSGGEQQMVVISRALMARPQLLLLDEPSLGLSPLMVKRIAEAIITINKTDNVSVILVEQNARMALRISTKGYVMETGKVALEDISKNLINNDHVRRFYLGG